MDIVDIVSMLLALVVSGAYLCRLAALNWKQHAPLVIVMHAGVGLAAMLSGVHAWMGNTDVQDVAVEPVAGQVRFELDRRTVADEAAARAEEAEAGEEEAPRGIAQGP